MTNAAISGEKTNQQKRALPRVEPMRDWPARLELEYQARSDRTVLVRAAHQGPLRVQRPFYPETTGTCHTYLLHPPGGMVIGDRLAISANLSPGAEALITTPSAGRIYGAKGSSHQQVQKVALTVGTGAILEWLPQETIVFDSANGHLHTHIQLANNARIMAWDIVRLGRKASGESFESGCCVQTLEVEREGVPLFIERNVFEGGSDLLNASWGLQGAINSGTFIATAVIDRDTIDGWIEILNELSAQEKYQLSGKNLWGLTQKEDLFIARFMGHSVTLCRAGFEWLWQQLRPHVKGQKAVVPRIWNT